MSFSQTSPSTKQQEYRIESANDPAKLAAAVTKLLNEGWRLDGSLQAVCPVIEGLPAPHFYQALMR
jgi:hypothetical protein